MLLLKTTTWQKVTLPTKCSPDLLFSPTLLHFLMHYFSCTVRKGLLCCCSGSAAVIYSCLLRLIQNICWTVQHQVLIRTTQDLYKHTRVHMYILGSNFSLNPWVSGLWVSHLFDRAITPCACVLLIKPEAISTNLLEVFPTLILFVFKPQHRKQFLKQGE